VSVILARSVDEQKVGGHVPKDLVLKHCEQHADECETREEQKVLSLLPPPIELLPPDGSVRGRDREGGEGNASNFEKSDGNLKLAQDPPTHSCDDTPMGKSRTGTYRLALLLAIDVRLIIPMRPDSRLPPLAALPHKIRSSCRDQRVPFGCTRSRHLLFPSPPLEEAVCTVYL